MTPADEKEFEKWWDGYHSAFSLQSCTREAAYAAWTVCAERRERKLAVIVKGTRDEFKGAVAEMGANRTLTAKDDYNKGWNAGISEAIRFVGSYIAGVGLFQIK